MQLLRPVVLINLSSLIHALPITRMATFARSIDENVIRSTQMTKSEFYGNLFTSAALVLLGGVFAGLTLGLMGQDEVYLKVIATSGDASERKYARKVLKLIGRGKHWVLVTLLLSNVITNETLPIVLDRCLGGGWPAVVTSTASIVIFGEIIPQSICVRYGLQVGAMFAPFVLVLMYLMYPVAYPCALLLDHILGEDHGVVYKKSGLKTLVTLHKTMGVERLNQDEVTIISAVLDLKEKSVANIMTPMECVYTMSSDSILDEKTVEEIFNAGFSRIPIHLPNEPSNFIGMLLVRVLISYDPEDALPVASFPLATLPETAADTSCLNILNYFQEGKSHMIVVSESPGEPVGALGVLTLEDVIEELIGEEIVDESDVYIDINKNIKRKNPGPLSRRNLTSYLHNFYQSSSEKSRLINSANGPIIGENSLNDGGSGHVSAISAANGTSPLAKTNPIASSPSRIRINAEGKTVNSPMLAPINPASNPLETSKSFVKIKRPQPIPPIGEGTSNQVSEQPESVPGPQRSHPTDNGSYDPIFTSEEAALKKAQEVLINKDKQEKENKQETKSKNKKPKKKSISNENPYSVLEENGKESGNNSNEEDVTEFSDTRSYRTGGIVESVVNVQGVHKTIIEDISDSDSSDHESHNLSERLRLI